MKILIVDHKNSKTTTLADSVQEAYAQEIAEYLNARHGGEDSGLQFKVVLTGMESRPNAFTGLHHRK